MRQSQLFTKTQKEAPKDEVSANAQLLIRAGFVDKLMGGVYSFLPLGLRVFKKIENIIRREMDAINGQEILMPSLHPKEIWETTGRWDALDVLFKFKDPNGKEYALGPTHEETVVPLAQKHIRSYKDLPFAVYQIQNKFRAELRAKSGLFRGREFFMKDLYSFHATERDLDRYYEKVKKAYIKIFATLGIGDMTFVTFASGGTFAKFSHEFQTVNESGEDTIYLCKKCKTGINKEIREEVEICPECEGTKFEEKKSIEVGNIFKLKEKYSTPFGLTVTDESGKEIPVIMGCYGLGLNRVMGTIAELHHDERGLLWPESVAPYKLHLLSLNKNDESEKLYEALTLENIEALYDDRDARAGEKFSDADLIGIPYRAVVSEKSLASGGGELKKRSEGENKNIPLH